MTDIWREEKLNRSSARGEAIKPDLSLLNAVVEVIAGAAEKSVCPNCDQWVRQPANDCFNQCRKRGFA